MPPKNTAILEAAKTTNSIRTLADAGHLKKDNMYKIPVHRLEEEDGYNPRDYDSLESRAKIRAFADAYRAGHYVPPVEFRVMNGRVLVVEGHQRRRGALLALEEGAQVEWLWGIPFTGNDADRDARLLTASDGLPLKPLEIAAVIQRMKNRGAGNREIAERIGRTPQAVEQYLVLARANSDVKAMVESGQADAQAAIGIVRRHGDDAARVLKTMQQEVQREAAAEAQAAPANGRPKTAKPAKVTVAAMKRLEAKRMQTRQEARQPQRLSLTPAQLTGVAKGIDRFAVHVGGDELLAELREHAANDHLYEFEVEPSMLLALMEAWEALRPVTVAQAA
ncbi:putative transcriptional regulator [Paraburkholderia sp. GAS448]|jgi:hypothetical protein|uniref:hypothetical protein n=1 Tax=Paraburkholderia sp. GAS448 TaxID=3035136 RepID=UPI003D1F6BD8